MSNASIWSNPRIQDDGEAIKRLSRSSLSTAATDAIRDGIRQGEWVGALPGERQLSARLRISRPTLRLALAKLEKEGLITGGQGKSRRITVSSKRSRPAPGSKRIAFLSSQGLDRLEPFAVLEIDHLRDNLGDLGYRLDVISLPIMPRARTDKGLQECVESNPSAAWILYRSPRSVQEWFNTQKQPAIIMGTAHAGVALPYVDIDFRATARHAVGVLRQQGHAPERLVMMSTKELLAGIAEAHAGFHEGLGSEPATADSQIIRYKDLDTLPQQLTRLFSRPIPPTGIVINRAMHSLTALGHLTTRLKLSLPSDVSLITLDDDPVLRYTVPQIARYTVKTGNYTRQLTKCLERILEHRGSKSPKAYPIVPDLLLGETVGPPPAGT